MGGRRAGRREEGKGVEMGTGWVAGTHGREKVRLEVSCIWYA